MKKLILFLLLVPASLYGANATKDAASSTTSGASTSNQLTWNHTLGSGTERYLIVGVNLQTGGATSATASVTGIGSMAVLGNVTDGGTLRTMMFGLAISDATATGAKTIVVGANNSVPMAAAAVSFFGVYQTTPTGAVQTTVGNSGTVSVTVSGNPEDLIVDVAGMNNSLVQPVTCNQTLGALAFGTHAVGPQNVGIGMSTKASAVNTVMSWGKGVDTWLSIGVAVRGSSASNPPGGGTPNTSYFFKQNNTWVQKIPANPTIISPLVTARIARNPMTLSNSVWSNPVWRAQVGDPVISNWGITSTNPDRLSYMAAEGSRTNIPLPAGAKGAKNDYPNQYDRHMTIVSADGTTAWDFYGACTRNNIGTGSSGDGCPAGGPETASFIKKWNLDSSDGICGTYPNNQPAPNPCPRAAGVSTLHGLITYEEIHTAGVINHAVGFVYGPYCAAHNSSCQGTLSSTSELYPANTVDGGNCGDDPATATSGTTDCATFGQRLQLNPSVDVNTCCGFNWKDKIIAKAIQDYGMIFVDLASEGSFGPYAEDLEFSSTRHWNDSGIGGGGVTAGATLSNLPTNQLRMVSPILPPFQGSTPAGTITVVSPISGLLFFPGQTLSIGWISTGVTGNVNIYISYNSGSTYQTNAIVSGWPTSTPNATWPVTAPTGTGIRVKVVDATNAAVFGESGIFTIGGQATGLKK